MNSLTLLSTRNFAVFKITEPKISLITTFNKVFVFLKSTCIEHDENWYVYEGRQFSPMMSAKIAMCFSHVNTSTKRVFLFENGLVKEPPRDVRRLNRAQVVTLWLAFLFLSYSSCKNKLLVKILFLWMDAVSVFLPRLWLGPLFKCSW